MYVNMELKHFIIYLCSKCTYKLLKSVCAYVYSKVCFTMCASFSNCSLFDLLADMKMRWFQKHRNNIYFLSKEAYNF